MIDMKTQYLTQKEVAEILGIKLSTLNHHRCIKAKGWEDLPYIKIGKIILYPEDKFYEWLKSKTINMEVYYD
ncbi:helix-turn-helix domain-containing protein [bacterium]|nr:helix-turn-helix domain-containing protein [bacterium]